MFGMNTKCRVKHRSHVVSRGESDNNDKRKMAAFSGKKNLKHCTKKMGK